MEQLLSVLDLTKCPVCYDALSPLAAFCVNGHGVCGHCKASQNNCPTCRGPFSHEKHTLLRQILEALPGKCRFEGCEVIDSNIADHETWCGMRPEKCRKCPNWSGPASLLLDHVKSKHILTGTYVDRQYNNFELNVSTQMAYANVIGGELCWWLFEYSAEAGILSLEFIPVARKKPKNDSFEVTLDFSSEHCLHMSTLQVMFKPTTENIRLLFDKKVLKNCINEEGNLMYKLIVNENSF